MREPPGPCGAGRLRCAYVFVAECLCLRVGAGGRRPAREIATRELRSEWSISKPGQALPPPTGTAARPCRRPPAPRPGPAAAHRHRGQALPPLTGTAAGPPVSSTPVGHSRLMVLGASAQCPARPCRRVACFVGPGRCVCRWAAARPRDRHTRASLGVVDLEARPGPAAAHQHRGQAPQASRRPPIGRGVCVMPGQAPQAPRRPRSVGLVVCVLTGSAVAHLRRGQVLQSLRRPPHRRGLVCWCVVRRSVISHAIRRPHCAGLYQFVMLRHLCL